MEKFITKQVKRNNKLVDKEVNVNSYYTWFITNKEALLVPPENEEYVIVFNKYSKIIKTSNVI